MAHCTEALGLRVTPSVPDPHPALSRLGAFTLLLQLPASAMLLWLSGCAVLTRLPASSLPTCTSLLRSLTIHDFYGSRPSPYFYGFWPWQCFRGSRPVQHLCSSWLLWTTNLHLALRSSTPTQLRRLPAMPYLRDLALNRYQGPGGCIVSQFPTFAMPFCGTCPSTCTWLLLSFPLTTLIGVLFTCIYY